METLSSNETLISRQDSDSAKELMNIHGFDYELTVLQKMIRKRVNNNDFKAIGIIGEGGIGKSTICKALLKTLEVKTEFLPRIWVPMSRDFDGEDDDPKIALLNRILTRLGAEEKIAEANFPSNTQKLTCLLYALHLQLRCKRYLIILDDFKQTDSEDEFYSDLDSHFPKHEKISKKLTYGLPKGHGGTVIVTSRSEKAAKCMVPRENNLHRMVPFSDPETFWEIFKQEFENENGGKLCNSSDLEKLKRELLETCGGVPLAAKMMGQIKLKEIQKSNYPINHEISEI